MRISEERVLAAVPSEVWRLLTSWEDQGRWMKDVDSIRVRSRAREGVGVRVAARTLVFGVPLFTDEIEVTLWDPPRRLVIAHRRFVRGTGTWSLIPAGQGTRFRWTEDVRIRVPLLGPIALVVYRPRLRRLMRGALADLSVLASGRE